MQSDLSVQSSAPTAMNRFMSSTFATLQRLGQALTLPVAVLPAAGLMVALGRMFTDFTKNESAFSYQLGKVLYSSGLSVFEQLSLIFAVGVALGFTSTAGTAGLAAVTGYFAFASVLKTVGDVMHLPSAINTGVFGGICVGFLVAWLYNRYHAVKLHPVLGFFSGKRLIPIVSVFASVFLALLFVVIWPPIQNGIHTLGESTMASPFGPSIYAAVKRLLIPVGLHHVFYPSFLYEFGEFTTAAGTVVHGDSTRYFAGDPTAGRFMASEFPIMIFGLPAAALAMTLRAKAKNRKLIAGVMLSAALTSIITGITEPIEFAYTFVAPPLYVLHAIITFFAGYLTTLFDIHLGYTFSSGLIDLVLGLFNQKNVSYLFFIVGPVIGVIYFATFYWAIGFFDFKTPGREDEDLILDATDVSPMGAKSSPNLTHKATQVLAAIGGASNITNMDACITRLRLILKDDKKLDEPALKRQGASGVMKVGGGNVQIVFGVESDFLKTEIQNVIASQKSSGKKVTSPISGKIVALKDIPDETFAGEIMGKTIGILPSDGIVVAPFDGEVATLFHTNHALGLISKDGLELLIHVGIDTVKMNGEGFKAFVKTGQKLLEFNRSLIEQKAKSLVTPIVITNPDQFPGLEITAQPGSQVTSTGDSLWKYS
jgi:glucose-specific phosphotransferase system IIA component